MTQFIAVNFFAITTWIYFYWCRLSRDSVNLFGAILTRPWVSICCSAYQKTPTQSVWSCFELWENAKKRIQSSKKLQKPPKTTQNSHLPHPQHNKFAFYYVLITIISIYKSKFKKETANEIDLHSRSLSIEIKVYRVKKSFN